MPRRSISQKQSQKDEGETPPETEETEGNMESNEAPADPPVDASADTPASSSRPKRIPKKNVLYNNDDYELSTAGPIPSDTPKAVRTGKAPSLSRVSPPPAPNRKRNVGLPQSSSKGIKKKASIQPAIKDGEEEEERIESDEDAPELEEEPVDDGKGSGDDDDAPPVLGPSAPAVGKTEVESEEEVGEEEDEASPPELDKEPVPKKRGRPKKNEIRLKQIKVKIPRAPRIVLRPPPSEAITAKPTLASQHYVKLFHEGLDHTEDNDAYATVIGGCLTELLRKERIIELLTNPSDFTMMFEDGWMIAKPPRLPPLTADKGCFVFYVDGSNCKNAKDISCDDLRPWSSTSDPSVPSSINIKPNVRRHPVAKLGGQLRIVKHETRLADYHLTEYSARLPREERLRKKIFYLTRDNRIYGNVMILYNYVRPGNIPAPIILPHGNDLLRNAALEDIGGPNYESPFEPEAYEGLRGGYYLKLRSSKLGWAHNKKHLLDYLINKQDIFGAFNAINNRLPDLPPLIDTVGVFAYFVSAEYVVNQVHHAADGLSPWTTIPGHGNDESHAPRVRSTRKPLVYTPDGTLQMARDPKAHSSITLVETMSTLARCKRIRKRVFYIQQNNAILIGNICYIYEFLFEGPIPDLYPAIDMKQYNPQSRWSGIQKKEEPPIEMSSHMLNDPDSYGESMLIPMDDDDMVQDLNPHKNVLHLHDHRQIIEEEDESLYPDMPPGGYDPEFNDDPIDKAENLDPYYDLRRHLSTGHVYLTIRHKKLVCSFDHVLEWIANTNIVEDRTLLNDTKPLHPPLVTNSRAYAFFVAATAIFPHDINRDDFSPWSHNGNSENPVCYRTKVRKIGVFCDPITSLFQLKDTKDYKSCAFHLVYLYSINPKDPRLRKKIYYMMETQSKMVVSHALIVYDYNTEGNVVKINASNAKLVSKKFINQPVPNQEYLEEIMTPEEDRDCPFNLPAQKAIDGTMYLQINDSEFWNDRNRQIEYMANQPQLVQQFGCLNNRVPDLPPTCIGKATYVFFVNGDEINTRALTIDKLCPWSENSSAHSSGPKRPKSSKTPLGLNAEGQLRLLKSAIGIAPEPTEYQLHIYTATLPRAIRLRKKVVYIQHNGRPFGNAMVMYAFTEHGPMPEPIEKYQPTLNEWFMALEERLQNTIEFFFESMSGEDTARKLLHDFGFRLNVTMLEMLKKEGIASVKAGGGMYTARSLEESSSKLVPVEEVVIEEEVPQAVMDHELMVEEEIIIESTEEITDVFDYEQSPSRRNHFLDKNVATAGFVRGHQRYEAMWRIAQKHFGANNTDEAFDEIFKLLYEKNEERLLYMINHTFNVDICATDDRPLYEDHVHYMGDPHEVALDEAVYLPPTLQRNMPIPPHRQVLLNNHELMRRGNIEFDPTSAKRMADAARKPMDQPGTSSKLVAEEPEEEEEKIMI